MEAASPSRERPPTPIALVITELEPGGAERCLVEVATRLDRSQFSPVVYSLAPPPCELKRLLVARLVEAQIPTSFLGFTRPWDYFAAVRKLAAMLHEQRAQLVQTFLFHANVVGTQAARTAGVPHVVTGIRVADPRWWRTALEWRLTTSAERHVCVSQSVAGFCRRHGYDSEKLVVIPNGIDVARWRDARPAELTQFGVPAERRVLMYVGRLDSQKGLDRFLGELPRILRELPEYDFVLVGEGRQQSALVRLTRRYSVSERVHFLGWRDDVPSLVAASDLIVLPSRWEGMPNVVLEAMAAGKPVIATQAEGTVELLGLAALDQTAPVGDWHGLSTRLMQVATNRALAESLGHRNQGRAQQFSLDFVAERYQHLYDSLIA